MAYLFCSLRNFFFDYFVYIMVVFCCCLGGSGDREINNSLPVVVVVDLINVGFTEVVPNLSSGLEHW